MSYSIIQADLAEHRETIISLWERNFNGIAESRFDWIYENNPSGKPTCFLLRHEQSDALVGALTLFPRTVYLHGKATPAYVCGDFVVDTTHRALGPALSLLRVAISKSKEESAILFGFPNKASEPVMIRAGFERLSDVFEMTKIIKTSSYLRRFLAFPFVVRFLAYFLDSLIHIKHAASSFKANMSGLNCEVVASFDERFDCLWKNINTKFTLKGEVSSSYLNWRYNNSPYGKYNAFVLSKGEHKDMVGYLIFSIVNNKAVISDMAWDSDDRIFNNLFYAFIKHHHNTNIESIGFKFSGNPVMVNMLKSIGFIMRDNQFKTVIHLPSSNKETIATIKDGNWLLTSCDNDI